MGIIKRQSIKSTIVAYGGVVLGYINVAILFPLFLSTEQIGLLKVIMSMALLMIPFMSVGIGNVAIKFNPDFQSEKAKKQIQALMFAVPLLGFALISLLFFIFKDQILGYYSEKSPLFVEKFYYVFPIAFFFMFFTVWSMYTRTLQRIVVPNILKEVAVRAVIFILLIAFGYSLISFDGILNGYVIIYIMIFVILLFYINKLRRIKLDFGVSSIKKGVRKDMFWFGVVTLLGGTSNMLVSNIDSLMLASMKDLSAVGVYTIAFFFATVIEMPKRSVSQITTPMLAGAWSRNDVPKLAEFYKKSANNQFIAGFVIFLIIWCNVDNIFAIMPNGEAFAEGKYVILFIGIAKLIVLANGLNSEIILNSKFYYMNLIGMILLAVLIFFTNKWLIPIYGLNGAAFASMLSLLLFNLYKFIVLYMKARITNISVELIKSLSIFAVGMLVFTNTPSLSNPFLDAIVRSGLIVTYCTIAIYFMKASPEMESSLRGIIQKAKTYL